MKLTCIIFLIFTATISFSQTDNCLDFDGIEDYVFIGDVNDMGVSDFTIEAWIYMNSNPGNGNKIISKGITMAGTPSNAGYAIYANYYTPDQIRFQIGDSNGNVTYADMPTYPLNEWHHVAGVRRGVKLYLFFDGVLVAQGASTSISNVDTNMPLTIGALDRTTFVSSYANGKIDEVRIWNVARTEQEINDYMDCAITSPMPNLVAVYNLNGISGGMVADSSGLGNHGTIIGGASLISSPVAPVCINGLDESKNEEYLVLYPNPVHTEINLKGNLINAGFTVYDITGNVIITGQVKQNKIQLNELISGYYIVEITDNNQIFRKKIVKR